MASSIEKFSSLIKMKENRIFFKFIFYELNYIIYYYTYCCRCHNKLNALILSFVKCKTYRGKSF